MTSSGWAADGRSLAECTATSARPSSTACWTSLTNTPCPPISVQRHVPTPVAGGLDEHELDVDAGGGVDGVGDVPGPASTPAGCRGWRGGTSPSAAARAPDAIWARICSSSCEDPCPDPAMRGSVPRCGRARGAPRRQPRSNRSLTAAALRSPCGVPASWRRRTDGLVQQLGDDRAGDRLDELALAGVERRQPAGVAIELARAHLLGPLVEQGDQRRRLPGGRLEAELLDLLGDDLAHPFRLGGPQGEAPVGPVAEVVEVEQRDARQLADGALDVARHGDVDDEQRRRRRNGRRRRSRDRAPARRTRCTSAPRRTRRGRRGSGRTRRSRRPPARPAGRHARGSGWRPGSRPHPPAAAPPRRRRPSPRPRRPAPAGRGGCRPDRSPSPPRRD